MENILQQNLKSALSRLHAKSGDKGSAWVEEVTKDASLLKLYRQAVKSSIQTRLIADPDFDGTRFSNAKKVFLKDF